MTSKKKPTQNDFKTNYKLYYALIAGQVLIAFIFSYLLIGSEITFSWEMNSPFYLIAPILMLGCITVSSILFAKRMEEAKTIKGGLYSKLEHYRSTIILRSGLLEGANLICIIFYYLEQNYFFLLLFFTGFSVFLLVRPSEELFKEKYKLTEEERMEFKKITS